jgi:hypothetical protein
MTRDRVIQLISLVVLLGAFAGAVFIGGSNFVAVKVTVDELDPLYGAATRFAFDEARSNAGMACMVMGPKGTVVMLFPEPAFEGFAQAPAADTAAGRPSDLVDRQFAVPPDRRAPPKVVRVRPRQRMDALAVQIDVEQEEALVAEVGAALAKAVRKETSLTARWRKLDRRATCAKLLSKRLALRKRAVLTGLRLDTAAAETQALRAELGEDHGREGAREHAREIQDHEPIERFHFFPSCWKLRMRLLVSRPRSSACASGRSATSR